MNAGGRSAVSTAVATLWGVISASVLQDIDWLPTTVLVKVWSDLVFQL